MQSKTPFGAATAVLRFPLSDEGIDQALRFMGLDRNDNTDDDVQGAIANSMGEDEAKALVQRVTELEGQVTNRELAELGITDEDEKKTVGAILNTAKDRTKTFELLKNRLVEKADKTDPKTPLTNRTPAKTPGGNGDTNAKAPDAKKAALISNRASELTAKNPKLPLSMAYRQAQQQVEQEALAK